MNGAQRKPENHLVWSALPGAVLSGIGGGIFLWYVTNGEVAQRLASALRLPLLFVAALIGEAAASLTFWYLRVAIPITLSIAVALALVFPVSLFFYRRKFAVGMSTIAISAVFGTILAAWLPLNVDKPLSGPYRAWWGTAWFAIIGFLFSITAVRSWMAARKTILVIQLPYEKTFWLAAGVAAIATAPVVLIAQSGSATQPAATGPRIVDGVVVGKDYDLDKYEECKKERPASSRCEVHRLRRVDNPEYWPYPNVPAVKWPEAPREVVYRNGMTGIQYWQALCKAEAGEFIYRVVENVEGLYMIRPRAREPEHADYDRWVREDPYGYGDRDEGWDSFRSFTGPTTPPEAQAKHTIYFAYLYVERPVQGHPIKPWEEKYWHPSMVQKPPAGAKYALYYSNDRRGSKSIRVRYSDKLLSRYGYTWRGISRPHDRELGVAGGELIVVDLKTNEVLGMRRGFRLGPPDPRRGLDLVWWGQVCPRYPEIPDHRNVLWFLTKVAKPKVGTEYVPKGP